MHPVKTNGRALRFGLVGAGRIADAYVQAFEVASNASLAGVADVRSEAALALGQKANCPSFSSHLDLIDTLELDAVVVSTPPATHAEICIDILKRGIPVLCEKPICLDVETALAIRKAARDSGALFTMASKFRYADDVIKAREIVDSGVLGDVVLFENTFMSAVDMKSRWNCDPKVSGGGVLIDNGTHSVDIMRYFIGPLDKIYVAEGRRTQGLAVEETVRVLVISRTGVMGSMDLSWSLGKDVDHYISIYGSQGTLRVGWKQSTYRVGSGDWIVFGNGYSKVGSFRKQIENFAGAIQGHETLVITAEDAVASVAAIQSAYAAMLNGANVPVQREQLKAAKFMEQTA